MFTEFVLRTCSQHIEHVCFRCLEHSSSISILFLVNSAKPQLFFSACLLIAIALCFENNFNKNLLKIFTIINILIFVAMTGKFSFQLSGFLIWCLAFLRFVSLKNLFQLHMFSLRYGITLEVLLVFYPYKG